MLARNVSDLPKDWVARESGRAQKRPTLEEKRSMLDPESVGMMRLTEMGFNSKSIAKHFVKSDVLRIGRCSIDRIPLYVYETNGKWFVARPKEMGGYNLAFLVNGKRVKALHIERPKPEGKPLSKMSTEEIFAAGKGCKCRKRTSCKPHNDIDGRYAERPEKREQSPYTPVKPHIYLDKGGNRYYPQI